MEEDQVLHDAIQVMGECMIGWFTFCVTVQFSESTLCCKSKEK
jgi:hypothetical protein